MQTPSTDQSPQTTISVVAGSPTPEELAAVVAVLAARSAGVEQSAPAPTSTWCQRAQGVRGTLPHGRGQWRASAWPR